MDSQVENSWSEVISLDLPIQLHGYVDRIDVATTGEVRIVDYKTGKSP
ncbi:MAG: PD-(D/E)XK nuclease family protein, partial [Candidatus Nanopelagicaceae bacterium]